MSLGFGGVEIKETPFECMEKLKRNLPIIKEGCLELRNKFTSGQFGDKCLPEVDICYFNYVGIVATYEKIVDYNETGPDIEEVD